MYSVLPFLTIKDSKGSVILFFLQTNKLTYHIFMDADRLETPWSEKNCLLLIVIAAARGVASFFSFCTVSSNPNSQIYVKRNRKHLYIL